MSDKKKSKRKKITSKPIEERLTKEPTKWLQDLPAGSYNVKQLVKATGRCSSTIKQRLNLLKIPRTYDTKSNYPYVIYNWVGIEKYNKEIKL